MVFNDYKQILLNLIWGIIGGFLSYVVNFFLTPYITNNVGIEAYGFVSLGNTIISYINIVAISINSFAARFVAVHYHKSEYVEASRVYSTVLIANFFLSFLIVVICLPILYKLDYFLYIPESIATDVKILFVFVLFNYIINLLNGVFSIVAFIKNKTRVTARIKSVAAIIYAVFILGFFYFLPINIAYVGMANLLASCFALWLIYSSALKLDGNLRLNIKLWSWRRIKEIVGAGIFNSINSLGGTLGSGLDLIISNKYLTNIIMGQIAIGNQLATIVTLGVSLVAGIFQPKQLEAYSKNDIDDLVSQLRLSMNVCGFFGISFLIVFCCIGRNFLLLYIPGQDINSVFYITVIILVGIALVAVVTPLYYVPTLTLRMQTVCLITVVCGIINVIAMLLLIDMYASIGAYIIVGTTTVLNLVALILFPIICQKYLSLKNNPFWYAILKFCLLIIILMIVAFRANIEGTFYNWSYLICYSLLIEIIVAIVYVVVMFDISQLRKLVLVIENKIRKKI